MYVFSTWVTAILLWQAAICRTLSAILFFERPHLELDNIVFHFLDFGLSLDPFLCRELVILPSNYLTEGVSGGIESTKQEAKVAAAQRNI